MSAEQRQWAPTLEQAGLTLTFDIAVGDGTAMYRDATGRTFVIGRPTSATPPRFGFPESARELNLTRVGRKYPDLAKWAAGCQAGQKLSIVSELAIDGLSMALSVSLALKKRGGFGRIRYADAWRDTPENFQTRWRLLDDMPDTLVLSNIGNRLAANSKPRLAAIGDLLSRCRERTLIVCAQPLDRRWDDVADGLRALQVQEVIL